MDIDQREDYECRYCSTTWGGDQVWMFGNTCPECGRTDELELAHDLGDSYEDGDR